MNGRVVLPLPFLTLVAACSAGLLDNAEVRVRDDDVAEVLRAVALVQEDQRTQTADDSGDQQLNAAVDPTHAVLIAKRRGSTQVAVAAEDSDADFTLTVVDRAPDAS